MPVELTPNGTRGGTVPRMPGWLVKPAYAIAPLFFRSKGIQLGMLTTVGSKTGEERQVQLSIFPDGENAWIVIASAGGATKHPGWFFNMARNPDKVWLETGGRKMRVEAQSLKGAEREAAWQKATAVWPGYNGYKAKTDRDIPVVRLTPAD